MNQATGGATEFSVEGMTCDHCVRAVTREIGSIDGVSSVDVRLESGMVTVYADRDLSTTEVAAAVEEAGYTLVS